MRWRQASDPGTHSHLARQPTTDTHRFRVPPHLHEIVSAAKAVLGIRVGASALNYIVIVVLARMLGSDAYGVYTYVFAWLAILSLVARVGLPAAAVHYLPNYVATAQWHLVAGFLRTALRSIVGVAMAIGILAALVVVGLRDDIDDEMYVPLLCGLLALPIPAVAVHYSQVGRAFGWVKWAYGPPQFLHPVLVLAGATGLWLGNAHSATTIVLAALGASLALAALQAWVYRQRLRPQLTNVQAAARDPRWLRAGLTLLVVDGLWFALSQIDVLLLGGYVPASEIGHYGAAVRVSMLVHFFMQAMVSLAEPRMAALWSDHKLEQMRAVWRDTLRFAILPTIAVTVVIVALGRDLLGLFGAEFESAYSALTVLALGNLCSVAVGPSLPALKAAGRRRPAAIVFACACVVAVALDVILIPLYGTTGAAVGTALTVALAHAVLAVTARHSLWPDQ